MHGRVGKKTLFCFSLLSLFFFTAPPSTLPSEKQRAWILLDSISEQKITTKIGTNLLVSHESKAGTSWNRNQAIDFMNPSEFAFNSAFLEQCKFLKLSVLRFPGGMISNFYRWLNGIGPLEYRPYSIDDYNRKYISRFGTIEFAAFCNVLGAEKIITVNSESATPREAANWVEFCNAKAPVNPDPQWTPGSYGAEDHAPEGYFAWLRSYFGYPKPLNACFWEIGNEIMLHKSPAYLARAVRFSRMMKQADPTISVGFSADSLKYMKPEAFLRKDLNASNFDFLVLHYYSAANDTFPETSYYSNGESHRDFHVSEGGKYWLEVEARGTRAIEDPIMQIALNNGPGKQISVKSKQFKWYKTSIDLKPGANRLMISFVNDANIPKIADCNLFVRRAKIYKSIKMKQELWNTPELQYRYLFANNALIESHIRSIQNVFSDMPVYITEANTAYGISGNSIAETSKLKSALWLAGLMNSAIRTELQMLCHWLLNDQYGFGMVRPDGHVTPTYYTFPMYAVHHGKKLARLEIKSPGFDTPMLKTTPFGRGVRNTPFIDAIASADDRGRLVMTIINRHWTDSIETDFDLGPWNDSIRTLTMSVLNTTDTHGMEAGNNKHPENVKIRTGSGPFRPHRPISLAPHSITNITFEPPQ